MKPGSFTHQTWTVFRKEAKEILRDKRTLFAMIGIPLLLIPGLFLLIAFLAFFFLQEAERETVFYALDEIRVETFPALEVLDQWDTWQPRSLTNPREQIESRELQIVIQEKTIESPGDDRIPRFQILYHEGEIRSQMAAERLHQALNRWLEKHQAEEWERAGLDPERRTPFHVERHNLASPQKVTGGLLGGLLPYLVVMLSLTGAAYAALDLTAGEKERGTLETILSSPVAREALVLGKWLLTFIASLFTSLLTLCSLGILLFSVPPLLFPQAEGSDHFLPGFDAGALLGTLVLLLPLAAFFSALLLLIGIWARSYREAQSYLSPVFLLALLPAIVSTLPGITPNAFLLSLPIVNVCLLAREMFLGTYLWMPILGVMGMNFLLAALALLLTGYFFRKESVLFRY
ncbi:MAG: ABC transporter permease subunit [Opitutales bacterium]|nr:ABC transporter permease subunit [Opitutales bacterium]